MEPRYVLRCLAQPTLFDPAGAPVRFRTRKHFALLVYLAVERRVAHRRERLVDLLWGSVPGAEGRHSLATGLSVIRGRLGRDALECGRETVRLVSPRLDVDLDRLAAGDVLGDGERAPLEVAGFLDGLEVADATEFMLWKEREQARLLPDIKKALVRLMDLRRRSGDFREIERLADRMLQLDHLSEEAIRAKMEARAFAGDRLTALRVYDAWAREMAEELGAQPTPLVEGMAIRLRKRGWEREITSPIPSVPTDHWKDRPFVGRGEEYRALYEAWERTQRGEPGHAFVLGDSGIGKTTLVERLTTAAALEGAAVARVQCYEVEREIPYAALGTLVVALLDRPGASATAPEALAELSRTVPQVRRRFPAIPAPIESQGETARLRLTEAFLELLAAVAEEQPVILVIDDLHHADEASVAVVHMVLRRGRHLPAMVMLLSRPRELTTAPTAARILDRAADLDVRLFSLAPITDQDANDLITASLPANGPAPSSGIRRALVRAAAGYPMLLILLVQNWCAEGDRSIGVTIGAITEEPMGSGSPLLAYRGLIDRTLALLDPATRTILGLAAILGGRLNDLSFYSLVDSSLGQVMTSMSGLCDLHLLRNGAGGVEFANEVVRAHAYLSVPSPVRKSLHSLIADRLMAGGAVEEAGTGLEVAWHCTRAGRLEEATTHLLDGAREAIRRGAFYEAELGLRTALPALDGETRIEASLLMGEALCEASQWREAADVLSCLPATLAPAQADLRDALVWLARFRLRSAPDWEYDSAIDSLLERLQRATEFHSQSWLARAISHVVAMRRQAVRAGHCASVMLASERPDGCAIDRTRWRVSVGLLQYQAGQRLAARETLRPEYELYRRTGHVNSQTHQVLLGLGAIACSLGEYAQARAHLAEAYDLSDRLGGEIFAGSAAANHALCSGRLGEYCEQERWSLAALRALNRQPVDYVNSLAQYCLGHAYARMGAVEKAIMVVQQLETPQPFDEAWQHQGRVLYCAELYELLGMEVEAKRCARHATRGEYAALHATQFAGLFAKWAARVSTSQTRGEDLARVRDLRASSEQFDVRDKQLVAEALALLEGIGR